MNDPEILDAFADALEAAAATLRRRANLGGQAAQEPLQANNAVARVKAIHPMLGHRQAQVVRVLESYGEAGTNTGVISRAIDYDQPNVYLTLQALIAFGFVEKDESTNPHTYRLTAILLGNPKEPSAA